MSYIVPNSTIYILSGVPLDPTYEHTLWTSGGATAAAQQLIAAYSIMTLSNQSYTPTRDRKNILRVEANAEDLYAANYLIWRNGARGSMSGPGHWFFAFVTSVDYVNEHMTELTYELDLMQTWQDDYDLGDCFVEREHSETDEPGDNTVPENVETGEPIYYLNSKWGAQDGSGSAGGYSIVVATAELIGSDEHGTLAYRAPAMYRAGVFSGLGLIRVPANNPLMLDDLVNNLDQYSTEGSSRTIVAMYIMPTIIADIIDPPPAPDPDDPDADATASEPYHFERMFQKFTTSFLSGYTPRNKKLLTYPYRCLYVEDGNGHGQQYRWELFTDPLNPDLATFKISGVAGPPPEVSIFPLYYAAHVQDPDYDGPAVRRSDGIRLADFPQVAWSGDSYKAWLAQNRLHNELQTGTGALGAGAALAGVVGAANPIGAAVTAVGSIAAVANSIASREIASKLPAMPRGQSGLGQLDMATGDFGVYFWCVECSPQFLRIIDNYFNKYGYATNRVKLPNIHSRPHWNYVKTAGCILTDINMPGGDAAKIAQIYDRGVTFWRSHSEVGNYALDNSPITGGD